MVGKWKRREYGCGKGEENHCVSKGDTVSGDSVADSGAEDHSQGSDFEKVTELDDFDEDLGEGSAVLPL
nr:hypothetical protein Iba_chr08cCG0010 [Ipomoea batatas]